MWILPFYFKKIAAEVEQKLHAVSFFLILLYCQFCFHFHGKKNLNLPTNNKQKHFTLNIIK